jgi:hypothetical protein
MAQVDFKGQVLCSHCWNGCHFIYKRDLRGKKTSLIQGSACEVRLPDGTDCECFCRGLLEEFRAREKAKREARSEALR